MNRCILFICAGALAAPALLYGQNLAEFAEVSVRDLVTGDSVYIVRYDIHDPQALRGRIVEIDTSSIRLSTGDHQEDVVPLSTIERVYAWNEPDQVSAIFSLNQGDRIRIRAPAFTRGLLIGQVVEFSERSITINASQNRVDVPIKDIDRLEVSRGVIKTGRPALAGLGGFLGGMLVGGMVGGAIGGDKNCDDVADLAYLLVCPITFVGPAAAGGLIGGLVGGITFMAIASNKTEEIWEDVPVRASLSIVPAGQQRYVGVTLTWKFGKIGTQ